MSLEKYFKTQEMYVKFGLWDHEPISKDGNLFDLFCVVEINQ
jgi:hypothetical protein